jgi:hypothetical protein
MAWQYRCATCDTTTDWMGRAAAEQARHRHRNLAHNGLTPRGEELASNAANVFDGAGVRIFFLCLLALGSVSWLWDAVS